MHLIPGSDALFLEANSPSIVGYDLLGSRSRPVGLNQKHPANQPASNDAACCLRPRSPRIPPQAAHALRHMKRQHHLNSRRAGERAVRIV